MRRNNLVVATVSSHHAECCGCSACHDACPKHCITMQADDDGFTYPIFDSLACIDCGLCDKVCPIKHTYIEKMPITTLAVKNKNEAIRLRSSSGGFFYALAEFVIIQKKGFVFGACFDERWNVRIDCTDSIEGIKKFMGAKYVQADVNESYMKVKHFLQEGQWVLFTGLPCQISGLNHFLGKNYEKLITAECVCHSVPSPKVWNHYVEAIAKGRNITNVNFRNKETGWSHYGYQMVIDFETGSAFKTPSSCVYMQGLVQNLTTRPSCSECMMKNGRSHVDFSMGDYWGVWDLHKKMDDDKGMSIVVVHTQKALNIISSLNIEADPVDLEDAKKYNSGLSGKSTPLHKNYREFFRNLDKEPMDKLLSRYLDDVRPTFRAFVRRILNNNELQIIKELIEKLISRL